MNYRWHHCSLFIFLTWWLLGSFVEGEKRSSKGTNGISKFDEKDGPIFCKGSFQVVELNEVDENANTKRLLHFVGADESMVVPPRDWGKYQDPQNEDYDFSAFLMATLEHNFIRHHDVHSEVYYLDVAPFVYMDYLRMAVLSRDACGVSWPLKVVQHVRRMALAKFYQDMGDAMVGRTNWVNPLQSYCHWDGIVCNESWVIVEVHITHARLSGTIPTELALLSPLSVLDLSYNQLNGTLPAILFSAVEHLDVSSNRLTGASWTEDDTVLIPGQEALIRHLDVSANNLTGRLPTKWNHQLSNLRVLDASHNTLTGPLIFPPILQQLEMIFFGYNALSGTIPPFPDHLHLLDLGCNILTGSIPGGMPTSLEAVILADNQLEDPDAVATFANLPRLELLDLQNNHLHGTIPTNTQWHRLGSLSLRNNHFRGSIPRDFWTTVYPNMRYMDISFNQLTGTLSTEIGMLRRLHNINAALNQLTGTIPNEMLGMEPNLRLNFTANLLTGTIPSLFCGYGAANILYKQFACDAVLCRPGTFNPHGHATLHSACRPCDDDYVYLGRTTCSHVEFVYGDLDADGILSAREILRAVYIDLMGHFWGPNFQAWSDIREPECELKGVSCNKDGQVIKVDLTPANICSDGNRRPGPVQYCQGLPTLLGSLSTMQTFIVKASQFLRGSIPTELGMLPRLQLLDITGPNALTGTIPSELGRISTLRHLSIANSRLRGTIPTEWGRLTNLIKLELTSNQFSGSIPSQFSNLTDLRQMLISRNVLTGSLPTGLGRLSKLENLEAYSNKLTGRIPTELGRCETLHRIDVFNNRLRGTLPKELADLPNLQILHLKGNQLTGTLPWALGQGEHLSWLDISENYISGTVPASFGKNHALKDLKLGGNLIYDPIAEELCNNPRLNGGATKSLGCDAILCPLGTFAREGAATMDEPCQPCPEGQANLYLGSTSCKAVTEKDMLAIFFTTMHGDDWPEHAKKNWGNFSVDACEWGGIQCNARGEIVGISFPLREAEHLP